jgi:hypothetical protein
MTSYTSKFEDDTSDILAMDSAFKALENENLLSSTNAKERIRRLIIRMNYIRQSSLQFSGAQVAGMLLDIGREGTHYTNSIFCRINLNTFIHYVQQTGGDFKVMLTVKDAVTDNEDPQLEGDDEDVAGHEVENHESEDEKVHLEPTPPSNLSKAIEDYIYRGDALQNYSIYELNRKTECVSTSPQKKENYNRSLRESGMRRGRLYNERICFQTCHSHESSQWTMMRSKQVVPCILGIIFLPDAVKKTAHVLRSDFSSQ